MIGIGQCPLKEGPGLLHPAYTDQVLHQPEGAQDEGPLGAGEAVIGILDTVAVNEVVGRKLLHASLHGADYMVVGGWQETHKGDEEVGGIQGGALIVLNKSLAAWVPAASKDFLSYFLAHRPLPLYGRLHKLAGQQLYIGVKLAGEDGEGMDGAEQLSVDIKLSLGGSGVADAHRARALVAVKVLQHLLGLRLLVSDTHHYLQVGSAYLTGALQPAHELHRLSNVVHGEDGLQRKSGIPEPAVTVVPVAHPTPPCMSTHTRRPYPPSTGV